MRTAAPATGQQTEHQGKLSPKTAPRPPPPTHFKPRAPSRDAQQRQPLHVTAFHDVTWMLHPLTHHAEINRQPRRLESIVSHTKQTPAPQINRQQMRTLHPAFFAGLATSQITNRVTSNRHSQHSAATLPRQLSLVTHHRRSNRHTPRLEMIKNPTKTHFSAVLIVTKVRFLCRGRLLENSARGSHSTRFVISNRQWQILEFNVTIHKTNSRASF